MIVLDPGHGGKDQGALGIKGTQEKGVVLQLAKRIQIHLANAGFNVYLTRTGDRFIELKKRAEKAKAWQADVFVSIHINAAKNIKAHGIETYILPALGYPATSSTSMKKRHGTDFSGNTFNGNGPNTLLGYYLQRGLLKQTQANDRGIRRARFAVLKAAPCPAALVECGFLSNVSEEKRIDTDGYQKRIALGISKGIIDYANVIKKEGLEQKD